LRGLSDGGLSGLFESCNTGHLVELTGFLPHLLIVLKKTKYFLTQELPDLGFGCQPACSAN